MSKSQYHDHFLAIAEKQSDEGWYCYGCARWLTPGTGVVQKRRYKLHYGLYCKQGCTWST